MLNVISFFFRIGLMGINATEDVAENVAKVLIEGIKEVENEKVVSKI